MINNADDCLIIVDVQNDFCSGGALEVPAGEEVVPVINQLVDKFAHRILTQDWHPVGHYSFASAHPGKSPFETVELDYGTQVLWPDHCIQGSDGAEFHPDLEIVGAELIIRKGFRLSIDSYSAFTENDQMTPTGLSGYLANRQFRRLFLTGLATDYCVFWSALDARRAGFEVVLIEDACRAIDMDGSKFRALDQMDAVGVVRVAATDL
ncbi:MAG: bifunctional nicotinamidase/pyrazinamidase [Gammaproteobacteria bacterium]|nr:bifunctional nicotinamidase/pyrazinamidase [Gammaproteobacteria bacterium]MCY4275161.1 bifunctional nicotinamidase/pyrazinamidase [Gammaproteobacteria bacterium]